MSEFKYLQVGDAVPDGSLPVEQPLKTYTQELIAEFDKNELNYALVHLPQGKTRKKIASGITREIKRRNLAEI
jgi:hypothetical protein